MASDERSRKTRIQVLHEAARTKIKVNDDDEADHLIRLLRPDWRKRGEIL
jgi:hypothetical protein